MKLSIKEQSLPSYLTENLNVAEGEVDPRWVNVKPIKQ
jgi:hypothetical protein